MGIQKESESLEGELMPDDVLEIYLPLMKGDKFIGAFEIYYDMTAAKQRLDKLLARSFVIVCIVSSGLLSNTWLHFLGSL
jgi:hypothetical protein